MRLLDNPRVSTGNAGDRQFDAHRGWFIGPYWAQDAGLRSTKDIEVKWSSHIAGAERAPAAAYQNFVSLAVLVTGTFHFSFPGEALDEVLLREQGDYVIYGPEVPHSWKAMEDSIVITVRWPG
ncbi:signal peptidase I [Micromonospora musae]|uniref:signal peptidase I n=1 Tax=Micromonospora musae TaxID=1894970 RepID=UPI0033EC9566